MPGILEALLLPEDAEPKRWADVKVSAEVFLAMLTHDGTFAYRVTGIPEGARVIGGRYDYEYDCFVARLEHSSFAPLQSGWAIPPLSLNVEAKYDGLFEKPETLTLRGVPEASIIAIRTDTASDWDSCTTTSNTVMVVGENSQLEISDPTEPDQPAHVNFREFL